MGHVVLRDFALLSSIQHRGGASKFQPPRSKTVAAKEWGVKSTQVKYRYLKSTVTKYLYLVTFHLRSQVS